MQSPGGRHNLPGFRTRELHILLLNYSAPFWQGALADPASRFKRAWKLLDTLSATQRELYENKIQKGIQLAHTQFIKMSNRLMTAPLIFNILSDPVRGPGFCRALRFVLDDILPDLGGGWGEYRYVSTTRPAPECKLVNLLVLDKANVGHFFQQLGMYRLVTLSDLRRLSRAESNSCSREDFEKVYPVLDECLEAAFGLLPSSSLLAEQAHGKHRQSLQVQDTDHFTDLKQSYIMNEAHLRRREVRRSVQLRENNKSSSSGKGKRKLSGGGKDGERDVKRRKGAIKLNANKEDCQLQAELLLNSLGRYNQADVDAMPGLPTVRACQKEAPKKYKDAARNRREAIEAEKAAKRTRKPRTIAQWEAKLTGVCVVNDANWESVEEGELVRDQARILSLGLWRDDMKRAEVIRDLPTTLKTFSSVEPNLLK